MNKTERAIITFAIFTALPFCLVVHFFHLGEVRTLVLALAFLSANFGGEVEAMVGPHRRIIRELRSQTFED